MAGLLEKPNLSSSIKAVPDSSKFRGWWLRAAILFFLILLQSCHRSETRKIVIRVWDYPRPAPQGVKKWEDHWEYKIFKEFERKHPGVKIEYTRLSWRNGGEKLDIAVLSGNPPDLAGSAFKNAYVERGVLEPIDRFLTHEDSTDILPQALQPFRYNGHIYAWPWYMTVYTLILNKRIFNERHVPIPEDGIWTWDEFVNAMQKLTFDRDGDGKIDVYGIAFTLEPDHNEAWAFIHSEGARVLIPVKNEAQSGVSAEPNGSRNNTNSQNLLKNAPPIYVHPGGFIGSPLIYAQSQGVFNSPSYLWITRSGGSIISTNFRKLDISRQGQFLSASILFALNSLQARPISEDTFTLPYRFGFNTPEGIRGVKKLYNLVWKYHVAPPQTGGLSQNETWNMFTEGRVAVTPQGTWAISSLVRTNRERRKRNAEYIAQGKEELVRDTFEFAVANFPIGSTGKVVTASPGVGNWVIFKQKDTTKLRLVMELAREITSAENQRYLRYMGTFPTRKSAGNIYASDPELGPYMSIIIPALENVVMRPFHPRWQQISDAVSRELQLAILGEKSVEQAMRDADRKVREILIQFEISKLKARRSGKRALVITLIIFAILMALIAWGLRKVNLKEHAFAYLALTPVFIIFGVFVIVPIILSVVIAFEQYEPLLGIFRSPFVGFRNFIDVVRDESFRIALKNTFIYTLVKVPWNVSVALILASLLYPLSKKAQSFYRAAYYLPGVASAVVISMIWRWIFDPTFGLANLILTKLGLPPQPWLTSPSTAFPSIILSDILMAPGSGVILYLATMGRIPKSVIESAKIDGAGGIRLWWHVIVPLLAPTTLFMLVVNTIGSFQVFTKIYILTKGGPGYATNTLVFSIYKRAFEDLLFGMASAEALILFVIVGIFSIFQFRMFSRELEY